MNSSRATRTCSNIIRAEFTEPPRIGRRSGIIRIRFRTTWGAEFEKCSDEKTASQCRRNSNKYQLPEVRCLPRHGTTSSIHVHIKCQISRCSCIESLPCNALIYKINIPMDLFAPGWVEKLGIWRKTDPVRDKKVEFRGVKIQTTR